MPLRSLLAGPLAIALLGGAGQAWAVEARLLRVCANQSIGDEKGGNSAHTLLRLAVDAVPGLELRTTLLPWQRCLSEAAGGQFDAALAASHTPERARSLVYPMDATGQPDVSQRMFLVGYALLKRKASPARWDGQRFSGTSQRAGEALGAERGYSIIQFAQQRGAAVEDRFPSYASLIESLRLGRIAGVLINQEGAAQLLAEPAWAKGHELSGPPLQQKAYYLAFNPRFAAAQPHLAQQLWALLAKMRQTSGFQQHFSHAMTAGRRKDIRP
ncbi:MAG: transporter substrate-binding domain-containing protein [Burkholderiales bacterium]|nr:transporter substrate-binding domain-containing protein [Burkholderiales bacterium]